MYTPVNRQAEARKFWRNLILIAALWIIAGIGIIGLSVISVLTYIKVVP